MDEQEEGVSADEDEEAETSNVKTIFISALRQFYCCSCVILLPFFISLTESVMARNYIDLSSISHAQLAQYCGGEILGVLFGGILLYSVGRKKLVIVSNLLNLLLVSLSYYAFHTGNIIIFYSPPFLGIVNRFSTIVMYFYIAEISSTISRPFFMSFHLINYYLGKRLLIYMLANGKVGLLYLCGSIIAICSTVISVLVPETPFWLALKGNSEGSEEIFKWIKPGDSNSVEYGMMLEKAEYIMGQGIVQRLSSHTFAVCLLIGIFLNICNLDACELQQVLVHDYYFSKGPGHINYKSMKPFKYSWESNLPNIELGLLLFIGISFVVPRKLVYGVGFLLTVLMAAPIVLLPTGTEKVGSIHHLCYVVAFGGKEPLSFILPVETSPAIMREASVAAAFIFGSIVAITELYIENDTKMFFILPKLRSSLIYFSYFISLIGVPFLLIFMPETKNKNMFELEEKSSISFVDIFSSSADSPEAEERTVEDES